MAEHFDFQKITTFAFDVDGVFTNSEVLVTETGELLRTMNTRDGQAVKFALMAGFRVGIFTKGFSLGVRKRFEMLGVHDIYDKLTDKVPSFLEYIHINQLQREEIIYIGDDIPDLPIYSLVGISVCPKDAATENLNAAQIITKCKGGKGCVREIIEKVMRSQNKWNY